MKKQLFDFPESRFPELDPPYEAPPPIPYDNRPFTHLGKALAGVFARASAAFSLVRTTESPIEVILGAELLIRRAEFGGIDFEPQYVWPPYRIDWAALDATTHKPIAFIECDGKDFHSTPQQIEYDAVRDGAISAAGIIVIRFTGSEINRDPKRCVDSIIDRLGL